MHFGARSSTYPGQRLPAPELFSLTLHRAGTHAGGPAAAAILLSASIIGAPQTVTHTSLSLSLSQRHHPGDRHFRSSYYVIDLVIYGCPERFTYTWKTPAVAPIPCT